MATINLGSIKFKWQGAYNGATAYTVDDVVSYNGSSYICTANSTGNLPTNTSYWDQMSSAGTNGTNGTDLTTTLTTQGDIVYRDGSGLARLAAGTNGQVLTTGGAGANPSWGTVSSDWVKLFTATDVSGTTIDIDNYFSSTYSAYKLYINNQWTTSGGGGGLNIRYIVGNTVNTSSDYQYSMVTNSTYSGGPNTVAGGAVWGNNLIRLGWNGGNSESFGVNYEVTIYNPQGTTHNKQISSQGGGYDSSSSYFQLVSMHGGLNGINSALTGIQLLYNGSTTVYVKELQMYGLKK